MKMRFKANKSICAVVASLIAAGAATTAQAAPEISFYLGAQMGSDSTVDGTDPLGQTRFSFPASWDGRSFESPPQYGLRATWWRSDNFGWQVDFNHTKLYADDETLAESGFETLEFTDGLNNLTVGPIWRFNEFTPGLRPYAGFGIGVVIPHVESRSTTDGPLTAEYQVAGASVAWMSGLTYEINDRWAVFGEYKGTYNHVQADLEGGGELNTNVFTHAINFGVTIRFH